MEINGLIQQSNGISSNPVANGEITKETFLQLLSTQLQHQDPLEPASDVEFIQQMATFAQLEQQQITNSNLQIIGLYENSINNSNALNIVGKSVKLLDNTVDHVEGQSHSFSYESDSEAARVNIRVLDEKGREVYEQTQVGGVDGEQEFIWHGTNNQGDDVPAGEYRVEVTLEDAEGNTFKSPVYQTQRVGGISYENGSIMVLVGDKRIPIENVVEVYEGSSSPADSGEGGTVQFLQSHMNQQRGRYTGQPHTYQQPYFPFQVIPGGK